MKFAIAVCALAAVANARPGSDLNIGASGAIADGQNVQFTKPGVTLVAEGPSAFLFSDGTAIQKRGKRSVNEFGDVIGESGVVAGAQSIQIPPGVTVAAVGPSAILLSNGQAIQRTKRSVNEFGDVIGESGVIAGAQSMQLPPGVTVAAAGPSAILLSNGQAIQRTKRSVNEFGDIIGESGVVAGAQSIQIPPGVTVAAVGPSAVLLSNGQAIQRTKRSVTDHADIIGPTGGLINGQSFHFVDPHGAPKTVASRGASGIVFSDGTSIQFTA